MTMRTVCLRWLRDFDTHRTGDITIEIESIARLYVEGGHAEITTQKPAHRRSMRPDDAPHEDSLKKSEEVVRRSRRHDNEGFLAAPPLLDRSCWHSSPEVKADDQN